VPSFLVLLNQHGQVLAEAVAVATLAVAVAWGALLVAALAQRQPSAVAGFAEHQLSAVHTLPAAALADQVSHRDTIMVVAACLPRGRKDSLAQSVDLQGPISAVPLQLLGNQTA
jgi:hypothetical protein